MNHDGLQPIWSIHQRSGDPVSPRELLHARRPGRRLPCRQAARLARALFDLACVNHALQQKLPLIMCLLLNQITMTTRGIGTAALAATHDGFRRPEAGAGRRRGRVHSGCQKPDARPGYSVGRPAGGAGAPTTDPVSSVVARTSGFGCRGWLSGCLDRGDDREHLAGGRRLCGRGGRETK